MKKNKRVITGTLAVVTAVSMISGALLLSAPNSVFAATAIKVTVDSATVNFPDQKPVLDNNRVLIPTRFVAQQLGGKVGYNSKSKTVTIQQGAKTITLKINSAKVMAGGKTVMLDVPAKVVRGRTMVPLRFVSEAMGATVDWNQARSLVSITTGTGTVPKPVPQPQSTSGFQFDPGFTTMAKNLFLNNIKEENGKLTFTVPTGATASFNTTKGKQTILTPGKTYTYSVGKGEGFIIFKYVDPSKVIPGAQKQSEYYVVYLDPSIRGYSDTSKVIVVTDDAKLNEKSGTLEEVQKLAAQL
ncbi:copper amine oxidase N-terminal domain-containing protein [Paenibacillus bovis]|uniref:Copper amine oxidase family protein n=1 Tax=Paenibacillus bovis TaxID=1616788 RepID=A0A1X9T439_9BACL|nr:copper amine oxidase N-terminal domain-containing protein [Paenibacillus bovis]ARR10745.1 copper amine oxidase family protein [Paenibacillus bovis]